MESGTQALSILSRVWKAVLKLWVCWVEYGKRYSSYEYVESSTYSSRILEYAMSSTRLNTNLKILSENGFSDMGPKIRFLCYQKRPFLIRHFLIKFSNSPILLENQDFLTGCGCQKMLLEKDFNSYRMTVSQRWRSVSQRWRSRWQHIDNASRE